MAISHVKSTVAYQKQGDFLICLFSKWEHCLYRSKRICSYNAILFAGYHLDTASSSGAMMATSVSRFVDKDK